MILLRRLALFALAVLAAAPAVRAEAIAWRPWSDEVFAQARREHKFVILDLEAVWCHWCHVMDATTYQDPRVAALLGSRYLAVKVDQDSRPDLASRYEDYGWPATIIYGPDGTEIVKKQGYVEPAGMARLLQAVIDDPSPVDYHDGGAFAPASAAPAPAAERVAVLRRQWLGGYDDKAGGWGFDHKFLDWDNVEYALRAAAQGDERAARMARDTLRLQRQLLDPVWGGMYQYSVGGDWNEPHFEKIMPMQAEDLRIYALAYAQWGDPADLATAREIHRFLRTFLGAPDGSFYVSQDADLVQGEHSADYFALADAGRRARGIPRVDTHQYARENGWAIAGLAEFAAVTGDAAVRGEAETAARWVIAHRALPGGGFRHDERDAAGPYLGDTLAMGRAFLALYQLTADPAWFARAEAAAEFIRLHFVRGTEPGFASGDTVRASFPAPRPEFDENVGLARFAAALGNASGRADDRAMAQVALRWLLAPGVGEPRHAYVGGVLLAEDEADTDPLHVAVVGGKDDPSAAALYAAALRVPTAHKLIEWWDRREGPAPRGEAIYPDLEQSAAFVCANGACSTPLFAAPALAARLKKILAAPPRS
jgi:uncharacterized protein YyaL (SSP411 family)